ncbi:MAG: glycosyltransferase [Acidobacteria bacterium]|nr:glycosyltransferase [Acidobacteriota bacterium]
MRICIVTAGHLSNCPRMLKAADALHGDGYRVRVVSVNHTAWAAEADRAIRATRAWAWTIVDYARATARIAQALTGARHRAAMMAARRLGPARVPMAVAVRASSRAHTELVRAATGEPADLVYGGSTGALAAVAESALRLGVPYGLDLEDFHSAEQEGPAGAFAGALMERIERRVLPTAKFLTASSPLISQGYADKYGVRPVTIHNTFSLEPDAPDSRAHDGPLRVYWFSQTLGPTRGLEVLVRAFGRADVPGELHLRARIVPSYFERLLRLQRETAPALTLVPHEPEPPAAMVRLARGFDAGWSGEELSFPNRAWCLGNKIFTYLAAGVPVILSRTPAHAALARDLGEAACIFDGVEDLAQVLRDLAADPARRCRARRAARGAAERRWHWEHPADRGALLAAVAGGLGR